MDYYSLARPLLFAMRPETAHNLAIDALRSNLLPAQPVYRSPMLQQQIAGLDFDGAIGLAAGFDKNAEAINGLCKQGFAFVEAGTVTPKPQEGNPSPRMFRLRRDQAVINRLGFNNDGLDRFVHNLQQRSTRCLIGANIGKNKDQTDAIADYRQAFDAVSPHCDYVTVNISSPNTPGLRELQAADAMQSLIDALTRQRASHTVSQQRPIFIKLAPDLSDKEIGQISEMLRATTINGLILGNTTISRPDSLQGMQRTQAGGLSGKPLFRLANQTLAKFYKHLGNQLPLIGVGGIHSPETAYRKIKAGASLVQVYTALAYQGFGLVTRIQRDLPKLLARDGHTHISQAIGTEVDQYL